MRSDRLQERGAEGKGGSHRKPLGQAQGWGGRRPGVLPSHVTSQRGIGPSTNKSGSAGRGWAHTEGWEPQHRQRRPRVRREGP